MYHTDSRDFKKKKKRWIDVALLSRRLWFSQEEGVLILLREISRLGFSSENPALCIIYNWHTIRQTFTELLCSGHCVGHCSHRDEYDNVLHSRAWSLTEESLHTLWGSVIVSSIHLNFLALLLSWINSYLTKTVITILQVFDNFG